MRVQEGAVGVFLDASGAAVQRWADGTEQQLLFKTHGRTLTYTAAKGALESKALKKDVTRNLMADMLVATYSSGQEVVGELLLKVSVAASCWLPVHGHDVFSGLGVLCSHGTCDQVKAEFARQYGDAFKSDVFDALQLAAADTNGGPGGLSGQVDNYVKGIMARKPKAKKSGETNFKVINTQTRAVGRCNDSRYLKNSKGGYGTPFDGALLTETLAAIKNGGDAVLCPAAGSKATWRLPLLYEPPAEAAVAAGSTGATAAAAAAGGLAGDAAGSTDAAAAAAAAGGLAGDAARGSDAAAAAAAVGGLAGDAARGTDAAAAAAAAGGLAGDAAGSTDAAAAAAADAAAAAGGASAAGVGGGAGGTSGTRQEHAQNEKFVERLCRTWHEHVLRLPLDQSNNLPRSRNPHAIRNHLLAPQVEALSADRNEFKRVWVDFLKDLFGRDWPQVHMGFCFDTEYIPHYESWLEDAGARAALKNTLWCRPSFTFADTSLKRCSCAASTSSSFSARCCATCCGPASVEGRLVGGGG